MEALDDRIVRLYCKAYGWSLEQDPAKDEGSFVMVHPKLGKFNPSRLPMTPRFVGFVDGYLGEDFKTVSEYRMPLEDLDDMDLQHLYRSGYIRGENLRKEKVN